MSRAGKRTVVLCLLTGLFFGGLAATAWPAGMPQAAVEYSADQTISSEGQLFQSRFYPARDRERTEVRAGGNTQVFITRLDKKVSWVLMPEQKVYMEHSLDQPRRDAPRDIRECSMTMKKTGTETVDGHSTTRNDIAATCPDGSRYDGSMWVTGDGIAVKIDATAREGSGKGTRILVELKNLRIGTQDPALFEVPAGYAKFSVPGFGLGGPGGYEGGVAAPQEPPPAERPAPAASGPDAGAAGAGSQPGSVPRLKKGSAEAGRSYTSTGRSYTAQPRGSGGSTEGVVDKAIGAGKKLKNLFGW